jgi:hypothetical protein
MTVRHLVPALAGIAALLIAFLVGRYLLNPTPIARNPADRLVTISASPSPQTGCEVDYPVASLRENINHIQWGSTDVEYWISFKQLGETPSVGYVPESPLLPQQDPVVVQANNPSRKFTVKYDPKRPENYYMYAIYDHDPSTNPNNPCKKASIEHDTGVIVKR